MGEGEHIPVVRLMSSLLFILFGLGFFVYIYAHTGMEPVGTTLSVSRMFEGGFIMGTVVAIIFIVYGLIYGVYTISKIGTKNTPFSEAEQ